MKLGPVTTLDKRNKTKSMKFEVDVMSSSSINFREADNGRNR